MVRSAHYSHVYKFGYSNMRLAEKASILVSVISARFLSSTFASRRQVDQYSHFTPFIRLWIVFLDGIAKSFPVRFSKSKLTNISYRDMQNLSSPSDCIQFSICSNKRMKTSFIIHISDSRNSPFSLS